LDQPQDPRIVVVTGLSGAGKSTAIRALEDLGYFCIDNLPVILLPKMTELAAAAGAEIRLLAIVVDARESRFLGDAPRYIDDARRAGNRVEVVFLDASDKTLIRRYSETRRRHPLDTTGQSIEQVIRKEMEMMAPVREQADEIIDTTGLTLNKLQRRLFKRFMEGQENKALSVTVKSFGYKFGLPIEADLLFDVRFMPNPFYIAELREKTGLDDLVKDYVFGLEHSNEFFAKLCDMMEFLLPHFIEEGKRYLVVCIGCTGGRHRSPAMAQALSEFLSELGYTVDCLHRDIEKE